MREIGAMTSDLSVPTFFNVDLEEDRDLRRRWEMDERRRRDEEKRSVRLHSISYNYS